MKLVWDEETLHRVALAAKDQPPAARDEIRRMTSFGLTILEITGAKNVDEAVGMIKGWQAKAGKLAKTKGD